MSTAMKRKYHSSAYLLYEWNHNYLYCFVRCVGVSEGGRGGKRDFSIKIQTKEPQC